MNFPVYVGQKREVTLERNRVLLYAFSDESLEKVKKDEKLETNDESEQYSMLTYHALCFEVQEELCGTYKDVWKPLLVLLAYSSLGHLFTDVGRHHWKFVFYKFLVFFLASFGIVTEDMLEEIDKVKNELQVEEETEYEIKKNGLHIQKYSYIKKLTTCMTSMIGCRSVLLQVVPQLSILTVRAYFHLHTFKLCFTY